MYKVISEATMIGIITFILGKVIVELTIKKDKNNKKRPKGIEIAFFITGFFLHFLIEYFGINKWYCDKECVCRIKNIIRLI